MVTQRRAISPWYSQGCRRIAPSARMAASPRLRIGVPESIPKTPMLVMVMVPLVKRLRRGVVLLCRDGQGGQRLGELAQAERVCVLDVGHHQTARGCCRNAEVDIVLGDDLLAGSSQLELKLGLVRSAISTALATSVRGVTRVFANIQCP